jgi:RNA polymerase sigma-70 factor (ECF subfamily)
MGLALMMAGYGLEAGEGVAAEELVRLLRLAKAGDLAAFEQIVIHHERLVFLTALRLLGRTEDAQDAAQEVFLRLYKHLGRFDEIRGFRPWLYRITVNVCRDVYRQRQRAPATLSLDEAVQVAGLVRDPQAAATDAELRSVIAAGLETLTPKERAVLVLRDIQGLPTREVARALGTTQATVRSQAATARLKIRKFAERFGKRTS